MLLVLIIVLLLCFGGAGFYGRGAGWSGPGYYGGGSVLGLILIVLLILAVMGRL